MRVELQTTGSRRFFTHPEAPIAVDVCRLGEEERAAFRQLVRQHTVTVSAAFPGPALKRLIDLLQNLTAD
jgi:hypothetical protein